jgi:hypothetical protein
VKPLYNAMHIKIDITMSMYSCKTNRWYISVAKYLTMSLSNFSLADIVFLLLWFFSEKSIVCVPSYLSAVSINCKINYMCIELWYNVMANKDWLSQEKLLFRPNVCLKSVWLHVTFTGNNWIFWSFINIYHHLCLYTFKL